MKYVYPVLISEIAKRGIKKTAIASRLGLSEKALYNKICGFSSFTWEETCSINSCFFPDMNKDELFSRIDTKENKLAI